MFTIPSAVSPGGASAGPKADGPLPVAIPVSGREESPEGLFGRMVAAAGQAEGPTARSDHDGVATSLFPPVEEQELPFGPAARAVDAKQTTAQSATGGEAEADVGLAAGPPTADRRDSELPVKAARDGAPRTSATGLPTLQKIQTPDGIDHGRRMRTGEAVDAGPLRAGSPDTGASGGYSSAIRPEAGGFAPNSSTLAAPQIRSGDARRPAGDAPPVGIATAMESGAGLSVKTAGSVAERIPASGPQNAATPASHGTTPLHTFPVTARAPEKTPAVLPPDLAGTPRQGVVTSSAPGRSGIRPAPVDIGAAVSPPPVQKHGQLIESRSGGGAPDVPLEKSLPDAVKASGPPSPAGGGVGVGPVEARYPSSRTGTEPPPPPAPNTGHSSATGQAANEAAAPVGDARVGIVATRETLSGMTASASSPDGRGVAETARDLPRPRLDGGGAPPAAGGTPAPGSASPVDQTKPERRASSAPDPDHGRLRPGTGETGQRQPAGSPEVQTALPGPHRAPGLTDLADKPQVVVQRGEGGLADARSPGGEGEPLPLSGEPPARSAAPAQGPAVAGPEQARAVAVARQLAEATGLAPNGQLEVSLSPEELGRVKLTITPQDAGLAIAIQAERPETLELMRRHIDVLVRELADEGFASLSFDFGQGGGEAGRWFGGEESPGDLAIVGEARGEADAAEEHAAPSRGGLDLRL